MKELIDVFRMTEIPVAARCKVIIKLGEAVNYQFGSNVTEPLVYELLMLLDPSHPHLQEKWFLVAAGLMKYDAELEKKT